ncbi:MAG: hypothetical protein IPL15_25290 [Comamonadaceae bacterium]|uniref:hypothetical protein n=1 Tax=Candidatus Skiveiella danica TaxID=3386177 RepID=UPI0039090107|nr:hypothetical protein [Comamonadaceae bacterium]
MKIETPADLLPHVRLTPSSPMYVSSIRLEWDDKARLRYAIVGLAISSVDTAMTISIWFLHHLVAGEIDAGIADQAGLPAGATAI